MVVKGCEQALFEAASAANQLFLLLLLPFCALFQAVHLPVLHESSPGAGFVQSERSFLELLDLFHQSVTGSNVLLVLIWWLGVN